MPAKGTSSITHAEILAQRTGKSRSSNANNAGSIFSCCRSAPEAGPHEELVVESDDEDIMKEDFSLEKSDLSKLAPNDDAQDNDDRSKPGTFKLQRASFLSDVCALVYADGMYWSSQNKEDKKPGDLSKGAKGTSLAFQYHLGKFHKEGALVGSNPLGLWPLGDEYNRKWEHQGLSGCFTDGLLHCGGTKLSDPDTQAMIVYRANRETLVLAFRGTEAESLRDMMTDMSAKQAAWPALPGSQDPPEITGHVHAGFLRAWQSVETCILDVVRDIVEVKKTCKSILVTGHSLGGGLATIAACRISQAIPHVPLELYTIGGAVVGDATWAKFFDSKLKDRCYRIVNDQDVIPSLTMQGHFVHVGIEVHINEIGLWLLDASRKDSGPADDLEGDGTLEMIQDHQVHNYLRLLDFFEVLVRTKGVVKENLDVKIKDLWKAFNSPASEVHISPATYSHRKGVQWSAQVQLVPNLPLVRERLNDCFGVEVRDASKLLQSEITRLSRIYKVKQFGLPIFTMAVVNLFLLEDVRECEENLRRASHYECFNRYDHDVNGIITPNEFQHLMIEVLYVRDHGVEGRDTLRKAMRDQFETVDLDGDGMISFMEYYIWRRLSSSESSTFFAQCKFKDEDFDGVLESNKISRLEALNKSNAVDFDERELEVMGSHHEHFETRVNSKTKPAR